MKLWLICLAAASLATAPTVHAASIVQAISLNTVGTPLSDTDVEHYAVIPAYGFDPTLGTLDSVSFEYEGAISIGETGGYAYATPPSGTYTGTASVALLGGYPSIFTTAAETAVGAVSGTSFSITARSAAKFDVSGTLNPANFIATTSPDALVTNLLDGPVGRLDSFSLTNAACGCTLPSLGSYGVETIDTHAVFTLTYGYTPIPEPASLALFCLAAAGLWSIRKAA